MSQILLYENVEAMIKVMPRIEALYYFVYELAESFHANEDTLLNIEKGILKNQIIKRLTLLYKDSSNKVMGKIVITIDWDKHFLHVESEDGKVIEIDLSKSVVDNIVDWKRIVVTHIDELMRQFDVTSVDSLYEYRDQLYKNDAMLQKTRELLGTVPVKDSADKSVNEEFQGKINDIFNVGTKGIEIHGDMKKRSFSCGIMDEVTLDVYYKC